jgi:hypothetical protein
VAKKAAPAKASGTKPAKPVAEVRVKENLWKAEYLGSGTFIISKPKRKAAKRRQLALKSPKAGMRKG